jgi:hypothetical protein
MNHGPRRAKEGDFGPPGKGGSKQFSSDGGDSNKEGVNVFKLTWHRRRIMAQTVNCCENESILTHICKICFL